MLNAISIIVAYIVSIVSVILFWGDNILLSIILLILSIGILAIWHKKNDLITFFFGVIFGWFSESICIYFGAWTYTNPTYLVPLWLPILWGVTTVVIRRFNLIIERKFK